MNVAEFNDEPESNPDPYYEVVKYVVKVWGLLDEIDRRRNCQSFYSPGYPKKGKYRQRFGRSQDQADLCYNGSYP